MKMRAGALILVVLLATVLTGGAQTTPPFAAGFETNALGFELVGTATSPWEIPGVSAVVTNSLTPKDGSAQMLYSADTLRLNLDPDGSDSYYSNIWWSAYASVLPQTNEPAIGDASAAFFLHQNGDLRAYSNNTWVTIQTGVPTNGWIQFAVHLDYGSDTYDVYRSADTFSHGAKLIRQNPLPLAFNSAYDTNELSQVEVEGETSLDTVILSRGDSLSIVAGTESPTNAVVTSESTQLVREGTLFSGPALRFFGDDDLDGAFGQALASWLMTNDTVSVYVNGEGWTEFEYIGDGNWDPSPSSTNITITATTGLRIEFVRAGTREPAFMGAFDLEGTYAPPVSVNTNWNLLSVPFTASARTPDTLGIAQGTGDLLAINDTGTGFVILRYNSGNWHPSSLRDTSIDPGVAFWYYRAPDNGSETWTVD